MASINNSKIQRLSLIDNKFMKIIQRLSDWSKSVNKINSKISNSFLNIKIKLIKKTLKSNSYTNKLYPNPKKFKNIKKCKNIYKIKKKLLKSKIIKNLNTYRIFNR